jgi:hypothetical protein
MLVSKSPLMYRTADLKREGFVPAVAGRPRRHFYKAVPDKGNELNQQELTSIPFRVLPSSLPFTTEIDADLAQLINARPNLSMPIRRAILAGV